MTCLRKRAPKPNLKSTLRTRVLPPLSNNEALALWIQASHLFHRLHWTSAAQLVTQILRRTSTPNMPRISRAKLWSNLCIVRFHLGDYFEALKAIEEALDEITALSGLTVDAAEDQDACGGTPARKGPGKARTATTSMTDFIHAGAARIMPPVRKKKPNRNCGSVAEVPDGGQLRGREEASSPPRIAKATTVANTITTMGGFIRAGAARSAAPSGVADRRRASPMRGTKKMMRKRKFRATKATTFEDPEANSFKSFEVACPEVSQGNTVEATRTAKLNTWSALTRFDQLRPFSACLPRPLSPPQDPLPFPPETPLLFFLAGLAAYHLPTTPSSPINYFRVAHAYFKRCLWSLTLLSRNATARPLSGVGRNIAVADDNDTYNADYADEYGVGGNEDLDNERLDEQAESFDFAPCGFAFVLSRRSVITNTLTCDFEAECVEGRGTLVVGRCRGVEGLGAGIEGVWFEAPLG